LSLKKSLKNCKNHLLSLLEELNNLAKTKSLEKSPSLFTGKMALYDVEMREEIAFAYLLYDLPSVLGKFFQEERWGKDLFFHKKKYSYILKIVEEYLGKVELFVENELSNRKALREKL